MADNSPKQELQPITIKSFDLLLSILGLDDPSKTLEQPILCEIEERLLDMALVFCPDAIPEIYHP